MIQAVILAGGLGTRLGSLTREVPKPLVEVSGKPFLHRQVEILRFAGIRDILMLVGYLGSKIIDYFGDGSKLGVHIQYAREEKPLGTGGALKNAEGKLAADFMLFNGDTLLQIDHLHVLETYRLRRDWGLIVAFENPERAFPNNIAVAPDGKVMLYSRRGGTGLTHVDAGVGVFSRRILELIPPGRVCSLEDDIYPRLIERGKLRAYPSSRRFYDIGTPEGLRALEKALAEQQASESV